MHPLPSRLVSQEREFAPVRSALSARGFSLGGGWDYDRGSFDCALDEARKVFLRLPFEVASGRLDSEAEDNQARIRFGQPYVLKHVYNEGLDPEAKMRIAGGLVDQFSDPADPDAPIEAEWIAKAEAKLREVERLDPA